jgi:hypothetical protein
MKTLQISDNLARQIYPSADTELKSLLEENFGKPFFSQKIMDRVKTFEDAREVLNVAPHTIVSIYDSPDEDAYKQLKIIVKALNEGWTPDWNNSNQPKCWPWFELKGGFRFTRVNFHFTRSTVGSRLCFKSRELAEYAAKQFEDLYKRFLTL